MVDDYVGYKALFADGPTELACLAHIRRKFFDVHAASGSPVADEPLRRIAALYAIEQQGAGLEPPQRLVLRPRLAMPALAEQHAWLLATQRAVAAGSGTAKAVDHVRREVVARIVTAMRLSRPWPSSVWITRTTSSMSPRSSTRQYALRAGTKFRPRAGISFWHSSIGLPFLHAIECAPEDELLAACERPS